MRTDQLDGETDWKLRIATPSCQGLASDKVGHPSPLPPGQSQGETAASLTRLSYSPSFQELFDVSGSVYAEKPHKDIYSFIGRFSTVGTLLCVGGLSLSVTHTLTHTRLTKHHQVAASDEAQEEPLGIENTMWANTVLASGKTQAWITCTLTDVYLTVEMFSFTYIFTSVGTAIGLVIYTGSETRSVLNTSNPRSKVL